METTNNIADPVVAAELGLWATLGLGIVGVLWLAFIIWAMWGMFRAHKIVPRELKGIREALERIANHLENKN